MLSSIETDHIEEQALPIKREIMLKLSGQNLSDVELEKVWFYTNLGLLSYHCDYNQAIYLHQLRSYSKSLDKINTKLLHDKYSHKIQLILANKFSYF